jgi:hypothetical protein
MSMHISIHARAVVMFCAALSMSTMAPVAMSGQLYINPGLRFEVRPYAGAYIPVGAQRDRLESAVLAGAQLSWLPVQRLALTGTFGWSPSRDRITLGDPRLDIYQYDVGAEWRPPSWYRTASWSLLPLVGAGLGGRTYDYRDLPVTSTTNFAGYGALGGEFGFGAWGVRVEARDYISQFKTLGGHDGSTETRNDITVSTGVSLRF